MATKSWTVTKDGSGVISGDMVGEWNGGETNLPVGKLGAGTGKTSAMRTLVYAPVSFTGMDVIVSARLKLYLRHPGRYTDGVGSHDFVFRRKTADWAENSFGTNGGGDNSYNYWSGTGADSFLLSYYDSTTQTQVSLNADGTDKSVVTVDITDIVKQWFAGSKNYGIQIQATNETNPDYAIEFYSRESSTKPVIEITYDTNSAPNAPTNLDPTGGEIVSNGTSVTCSGTRSDPDSDRGDYISAYQIALYKDDGVTLVQDSGKVSITSKASTFSRTMSIGTRPANQYYKWKARTWDRYGAVGPWSALQRVKLNSKPNVPTNLQVEKGSLTPVFSGGFSDPDAGDSMTAVQIHVIRYVSGVAQSLWTSSDIAQSGTNWFATYSGTALAAGVEYRWQARTKDSNGAYSAWSAYQAWTPNDTTGPTQSPRTTIAGVAYGGKINDTTPDLTISFIDAFTDHEVYVYSDKAGTVQVFSSLPSAYAATNTKVITVTTTLVNGQVYYWKARVFRNVASAWSEWAGFASGQSGDLASSFYINALPSSSAVVTARNDSSSVPLTRDSDGCYIVTTLTPLLEAEFNDADVEGYGDTPSARSIEIYNDATGALVHSNENLSPTFTIPMAYAVPAATLAYETTYKMRWRFQDNSDTYGAWSDYVRFKPTQPSSVSSVTPVGEINAPEFTAGWTFSSPGSKAQGSYRVLVTHDSDGDIVYDSGTVISSLNSHTVPSSVLQNQDAYTVTVETYDTDGV